MVTDEMVEAAIVANTRAKLFGGEPRDWVRAALEAALSAAEPQTAPSVAVKPLEWEIPTGCNDYYWNALSIVGQYRIRPKAGNGFELLLLMADTFPFYSSVEEAKAAAQADYEARILSALSAQVQEDNVEPPICSTTSAAEDIASQVEPIPQNKETLNQVAAIMLQWGTPAQQAEAIAYLATGKVAQVQDVAGLPQDVIDLVIAAREFWDIHNDMERESNALDKALEKFASRVPFEDANLIDLAAPAKQEGGE